MTATAHWTRRHWIIATLAMVNIVVLVLFGTIFPPQFAALRATVIAVWAAVGAILTLANVRHGANRKRPTSLVAFVGHPLFQVTVGVTTLTWPVVVGFHALDRGDVHRVSVTLRSMKPRGTGTLQRLDSTSGRDVYQLSRDTAQWTALVARGDYLLSLRVPGYETWHDTIVVRLLSLNVSRAIDSLTPERAVLTLRVQPRVIDLEVREDRSSRVIHPRTHYSNQDAVSIPLPRGRFWIVGKSNLFRTDSIDVLITSGDPIRDTLRLAALPPPDTRARITLELTPSGMDVILDDALLKRRTPMTISVPGGDHVIETRKRSGARSEFYWRWTGALSPGQHKTFRDTVRPVYLHAVTVIAKDRSHMHRYHMDDTLGHYPSAQFTDYHVFLVRRGPHHLIKRRDGKATESIEFFVRGDTTIDF